MGEIPQNQPQPSAQYQVNIPVQLDNQKFIKTIEKIPCELAWTTIHNYNKTDPEFQHHLHKNPTYGVLCGYNNLLVVDCDNAELQQHLLTLPEFQQTFTVKTATKGLYHFYFYTDEKPRSFKFLDAEQKTIVDGQGAGKQVIGPNSKLKTGKIYSIVKDVAIKSIAYQEVKKLIEQFTVGAQIITEEIKQNREQKFIEKDQLLKHIKERVKISDILKEAGISTEKNPTDCPFHSSVHGKCFSFTEELFHCFHCTKHGNVFKLYQLLNNCNFAVAKKALAQKVQIVLSEENLYDKVMFDLLNKDIAGATERMVVDFNQTHSIYTTKNDINSEVWIYEDGIYKPNGRKEIVEYLRNLLGANIKESLISLVTLKIEADSYINQEDLFILEDLSLIPVANGVLNWRTRELLDFSPEYKFFNKMPAIYNPVADCPKIKQFFKEILVDKTDLDVIQELFGYVLYRDYKFEKAFMFLGSGRNGKGKTLELMKTFIGADNCANISLQQLERDNFVMSTLFGKLANLSADISKAALTETGNFKSLTGHDLLTAARKFMTPIHFVNYAKMIFLANELPRTRDNSIGFFDRWIWLDFKFRFYLPQQYENLTEKTTYDKRADTDLIKKLTTPEELSGLLNWSLDGLHRLLQQNGFSKCTSSEEIKHKWQLKTSTFLTFFEEEVEIVTGNLNCFVPKEDLREAYNAYCQKHQVLAESDRAVFFKLNELGISDKQKVVDGIMTRAWLNIKLRHPIVHEPLIEPELIDLSLSDFTQQKQKQN